LGWVILPDTCEKKVGNMKITKDIIAVLIILAAIASLFFVVHDAGEELIRYLAVLIVGFYFGKKEIPVVGAIRLKTEKK